jgi:hypothetical protein
LESPVAAWIRTAVEQWRKYRSLNVERPRALPGALQLDAEQDDLSGEDEELTEASRRYWLTRGDGTRPAGDYRVVSRKMRLGRPCSPFEIQRQLNAVKDSWQGAWWWLAIFAGTVLAVFGFHLVSLAFVAIVWAVIRAGYVRRYRGLVSAQREVLRTEQPVWVEFGRRVQLLRTESAITPS